MIDTLFHLMAPDAAREMWRQLFTQEKGAHGISAWSLPKLDELLTGIADYYFQSTQKFDKIHALAVIRLYSK